MMIFQYKFVEYIPDEIEFGILYISLKYCTVIHKCVCGCGNEVVTPISRQGWQLMFDGESVSLQPSIGSWNLPCKSHYFIINNKVRFAKAWIDKLAKHDGPKFCKIKKQKHKKNKRHKQTNKQRQSFMSQVEGKY
jgi:hypothetical protein